MPTKQTSNGRQGRVLSYTRWSSKPQALGDSEKRQIEAAEDWCQRHGQALALDRYIDAGVSAYRGKNQNGELGRLVESLQPGDTLLVDPIVPYINPGSLGDVSIGNYNPVDAGAAQEEAVNQQPVGSPVIPVHSRPLDNGAGFVAALNAV